MLALCLLQHREETCNITNTKHFLLKYHYPSRNQLNDNHKKQQFRNHNIVLRQRGGKGREGAYTTDSMKEANDVRIEHKTHCTNKLSIFYWQILTKLNCFSGVMCLIFRCLMNSILAMHWFFLGRGIRPLLVLQLNRLIYSEKNTMGKKAISLNDEAAKRKHAQHCSLLELEGKPGRERTGGRGLRPGIALHAAK